MAYRKINPLMWDDDAFLDLSSHEVRLLWCYLLTGPQTTPLPGLFIATPGALAEGLRMVPETVAEGLAELSRKGRIQVDDRRRLIRVVNAPRYNPPENGNVLRSWWALYKTITDCPIKAAHLEALEAALEGAKPDTIKAWAATFGTLPKPSANPSETILQMLPEPFATHKHLHEHEQEHQHQHSPDVMGVPQGPIPKSQIPTGPETPIRTPEDHPWMAPGAAGKALEPSGTTIPTREAPTPVPTSVARPEANAGPSMPIPEPYPPGGWPKCPAKHEGRQAQVKAAYELLRATMDSNGLWKPFEQLPIYEQGMVAGALRVPPLADQPNPYDCLTMEVVAGLKSNDLFRKANMRQLRVVLKPDNLAIAIQTARDQAKGVNPNGAPKGSPSPKPVPKPEYYVEEEFHRPDPEETRKAREEALRATDFGRRMLAEKGLEERVKAHKAEKENAEP